jgi:GH24 family phage-related lysozyme (muramidase)
LEGEAHPTIGYGFYNVYPGTNRKVKKGDVLSQAEADRYLDVAIQERADNLAKKVPNWNKLTSNQQDALIDLAFNAGDNARHFRKGSKLMTALANEDWDAASEQLATTSRNPNFKRGMQNRSNRRRNMFVNGDYSIKAFGGELGTNGTDFTNGLLQVNAGNTHERNPFGGVPLGVDSQGVPNLVEEGETVFNDYVFSKRLKVPNFMLKDLGLGGVMQKGKRHRMSFADVSKKLAEESEMRPNDPISMNGLNASLSKLMEIQEAERMKQQTKMQNEEMEMMPEMGLMAACGGKLNKYDYGGALNYLKGENVGNKQQIAKAMDAYINRYMKGSKAKDDVKYRDAYNAVMRGSGNLRTPGSTSGWDASSIRDEGTSRKHYQELLDLGMDKRVAFGLAFPQVQKSPDPYSPSGYNIQAFNSATSKRNALYNELVRGNKAPASQSRASAPSNSTTSRGSQASRPATPSANNQAPRAQAAPTSSSTPSKAASNTGSTRSAARRNAAPATNRAAQNTTQGRNRGDIVNYKYDWYRNGDDGTGTHWGFTPDENGIIDTTTGYTDDYRNLVSTLTADDIRKWAAEHPNDPSLQSFLANNGADALTNLTDDQWRRGATDGRYGFMHHVAAQIGADNLDLPTEEEYNRAVNGEQGLDPSLYTLTEDELNAAGNRIDEQSRAWTGSGNPVADAANAAAGQRTTVQGPPTYKTWMRYAPAVGAGIFALTDALGITNKPDYTYADKLEAAANRAGYAPNIQAPYIGDYMRYTPFDRLFYSNQLQANARATDRALMNNSGANRGTAAAGLLANAYNTNNNLGNLYRQAEEYNRAQYERTKEFNRRTNMFNAQMGLEADMANARYRQQASQMGLSGLAQAANMRENIDARTGATRSANLSNLFTSLGNIGRENMAFNMINSTNAARNGYWIDNKGVVHYVGRGDGLV